MFRCFWNWLTSPIGLQMGNGPKGSSQSKQQRRRNKQRKRGQALEKRREETEKLSMPKEDIERNKELLKETIKRLNGFYRSREEQEYETN